MPFRTVVTQGKTDFADAAFLRTKVFVEEQGFVSEFDDIDEKAYHFVVYDGEKPAAVARLYGDFPDFHIGRVAVLPQYRGTGLGQQLMEQVEAFALKLNNNARCNISLSAQTRAAKFYEKCGYKQVGEEYYDEFCPHIEMVKTLG